MMECKIGIKRYVCLGLLLWIGLGPSSLRAVTTPQYRLPNRSEWSIPLGLGMHYKPNKPDEYTSSIGLLLMAGIKWQKVFYKRWTFSPALLWGLFLPDMFMNKNEIPFTIFKIITIPYSLALFLPMTSIQIGYIMDNNLHISGGLIYCYGLELNISYPLSSKIRLSSQFCLFLDKLFADHGIHLGFGNIGIHPIIYAK